MLDITDKQTFDKAVKTKSVRSGLGQTMHCTNYYDVEGNIVASMQTSSWNPDIQYRIETNNENQSTINIVSNIIDSKLK